MSQRDSTRVCVLTPSGRGAVAVVAVEGASAAALVDRFFQSANGRPITEQSFDRIVYGHWGDQQGEDLVVVRRDEQTLEIHCHGGLQSSAQIVADLTATGCTAIEPSQWLTEHTDSPLAAAAHLAISNSTTLRTATILLDQYHGALQAELETVLDALVAGNIEDASKRIEDLLRYADLGLHLTRPWQVVIAGQPNVGKSSLINALVGYERAIVFDQPGTTRDIVSSRTAIDGWPVELSDTAGLHRASDPIESAGIELARRRVADADLVVWVLDAVVVAAESKHSFRDYVLQQASDVGIEIDPAQVLIVINKTDLLSQPSDASKQGIATCAVSGDGIPSFLEAISNRLAPTIPLAGAAVPFTSDQVKLLQSASSASLSADASKALAAIRGILTSGS